MCVKKSYQKCLLLLLLAQIKKSRLCSVKKFPLDKSFIKIQFHHIEIDLDFKSLSDDYNLEISAAVKDACVGVYKVLSILETTIHKLLSAKK